MKKILHIISWIGFYILTFACVIALLSTLCGVGFFVAVLFGVCKYSALNIFAVSYFGSVAVVIACCLLFNIYEWLKRIKVGK